MSPSKISGKTKVVGVMGWPVTHTLSPAMHNVAFEKLGMDAVYIPYSVNPDLVGDAVRGLRGLGFVGSNVTVPHKVAVMEHLDHLTPQARVIGAVNTIRVEEDGSLTGHNTDCIGATEAIRLDGTELTGKTAFVLGAGGAGRGVAAGCAFAGASRVVIMNRTVDKAQQLVDEFSAVEDFAGTTFQAAPLTEDAPWQEADVILQMTSLGMHGEGSIPWRPDLVPDHCHVLDAVYHPLETEFLRQAKERGLRVSDGLSMLLEQGISAFVFWFAQEPDRVAMRAVLAERTQK